MNFQWQLPDWLVHLCGLRSSTSGEGAVWVLKALWPWPPVLLLLAIGAAVAFIIHSYRREGADISPRLRTALITLRCIAAGLLFFVLGQAVLIGQRTGLPHLIIVLDDSGSMGRVDRFGDADLMARLVEQLDGAGLSEATRINLGKAILLADEAQFLQALEADYRVKVYFLSAVAREQTGDLSEIAHSIRNAEAAGEASRLGDGVRQILAQLRGTPPAAMLLLTDGITTEGESLSDVASYAARKGVPLHIVGVGSREPVRDIELRDLLVEKFVFVDDVVTFQATVASSGYDGRRVDVVLRNKDSSRELARNTITLDAGNKPQQVRLSYRPTEEGEIPYELVIEPLEDEADPANNRVEQVVVVRETEVRVLLVQAYPSYEYRYLKHLLERDSTVKLATVLQEADVEHAKVDPSALRTLPVSREELFRYDVILFGDVNPSYLSNSVMSLLRDFVVQRGGGLAVIAGPQFTPLSYRDTPLAELFPVDVSSVEAPPTDEVLSEGFVPRPTDLGLSSPALQLGDSRAETEQLWNSLPPMYWSLDVLSAKRGAQVLAVHPTRLTPDGRPLPLILLQYTGAGKVLFHAMDGTWRWRYLIGDALFARYWVQSIRYLARSKLLGDQRGAELTLDRDEYRQGQPVGIRVRFVDERLAPVADDGVTVVIEGEGRQSKRLRLRRSATSRGIFEGVFTGTGQGRYHVWMVAPSLEGEAPAADFRALPPQGERERLQMDVADMARAAEASRGNYYPLAESASLLEELPRGRQVPIESLPPLAVWNRWWLLSLFLIALSAEWLLRKRCGLL